jgi:hypothetical protein
MQSKIIMIHEVNTKILKLLNKYISSEDILTFDDGLYSNYKYLNNLLEFPNKKIFFYSSGIIRPNTLKPNHNFIKCDQAHDLFNRKKYPQLDSLEPFRYYMSSDELKEIQSSPNCYLGVHGHNHIKIPYFIPRDLEEFGETLIYSSKKSMEYLRNDTKKMFNTHIRLFDEIPKKFCFPYNIENNIYKKIIDQEYQILLKKYDINQKEIKLYGKGRLNVYDLQ